MTHEISDIMLHTASKRACSRSRRREISDSKFELFVFSWIGKLLWETFFPFFFALNASANRESLAWFKVILSQVTTIQPILNNTSSSKFISCSLAFNLATWESNHNLQWLIDLLDKETYLPLITIQLIR